MKVEDIYRIIPCEERLPKDDGWYLTNMGEGAQYDEIDGEWYDLNYNKFRPRYWLEKQSRIVLTEEELTDLLIGFIENVDLYRKRFYAKEVPFMTTYEGIKKYLEVRE